MVDEQYSVGILLHFFQRVLAAQHCVNPDARVLQQTVDNLQVHFGVIHKKHPGTGRVQRFLVALYPGDGRTEAFADVAQFRPVRNFLLHGERKF